MVDAAPAVARAGSERTGRTPPVCRRSGPLSDSPCESGSFPEPKAQPAQARPPIESRALLLNAPPSKAPAPTRRPRTRPANPNAPPRPAQVRRPLGSPTNEPPRTRFRSLPLPTPAGTPMRGHRSASPSDVRPDPPPCRGAQSSAYRAPMPVAKPLAGACSKSGLWHGPLRSPLGTHRPRRPPIGKPLDRLWSKPRNRRRWARAPPSAFRASDRATSPIRSGRCETARLAQIRTRAKLLGHPQSVPGKFPDTANPHPRGAGPKPLARCLCACRCKGTPSRPDAGERGLPGGPFADGFAPKVPHPNRLRASADLRASHRGTQPGNGIRRGPRCAGSRAPRWLAHSTMPLTASGRAPGGAGRWGSGRGVRVPQIPSVVARRQAVSGDPAPTLA